MPDQIPPVVASKSEIGANIKCTSAIKVRLSLLSLPLDPLEFTQPTLGAELTWPSQLGRPMFSLVSLSAAQVEARELLGTIPVL